MTLAHPSCIDALADDLARLAPGCSAAIRATGAGGLVADLAHRITGRTATLYIGDGTFCSAGQWQVNYGDGRPRSSMSGSSAYGFDSALTYVYRHDLDFTAEHGPGTAWAYAQEARRRERAARAAAIA